MSLLVVDDSLTQQVVLTSILAAGGHEDVITADSATEAFEQLGVGINAPFVSGIDLILMDLDMPGINGLEACLQIKAVPHLADIPIIVVTASAEDATLQAAFDAGAMDYIAKPPNAIELMARVRSALRLKRAIDERQEREKRLELTLAQLQAEQEKSERLLLNILPAPIAERLKKGQQVIADSFAAVTVLFADVVDFTHYASSVPPETLIERLNDLFQRFDHLAVRYGVEKIKTSGDAYMAVCGVPVARPDHAEVMAEFALDIQADLSATTSELSLVRIGIHSGPVVAGVIGAQKFIYDVWGDTVNVASRMESHGAPGGIQMTAATQQLLEGRYLFEPRGVIAVKGKGEIEAYLLTGRKG